MLLRRRTSRSKLGDPYIDLRTAYNIDGFINLEKSNVASRSLNLPFNLSDYREYQSDSHWASFGVTVYNVPTTYCNSSTTIRNDYSYVKVCYDGSTYGYTPYRCILNCINMYILGYSAANHTLDIEVTLDLQNIPTITLDDDTTVQTPNHVGRHFAMNYTWSSDGNASTIGNFHEHEFVNLGYDNDSQYNWFDFDTNYDSWLVSEDNYGVGYAKDGVMVYFGIRDWLLINGSDTLMLDKFVYFNGQEFQLRSAHLSDPKDEGGIKFVMYPWKNEYGSNYATTDEDLEFDHGDDGDYKEFCSTENYGVYGCGNEMEEGDNDIIRFFAGYDAWDDYGAFVLYHTYSEGVLESINKQAGVSDGQLVSYFNSIHNNSHSHKFFFIDHSCFGVDTDAYMKAILFRSGTNTRQYLSNDSYTKVPIMYYGAGDYEDDWWMYPYCYPSGTSAIDEIVDTITDCGEDMTWYYEVICAYENNGIQIDPWSSYGISTSSLTYDSVYDSNPCADYVSAQIYPTNHVFSSNAGIPVGLWKIETDGVSYNYKVFAYSSILYQDIMEIDDFYSRTTYQGITYLDWEGDYMNCAIYSQSNFKKPFTTESIYNGGYIAYNISAERPYQYPGHANACVSTDRIRLIPTNSRYLYFEYDSGNTESFDIGIINDHYIIDNFMPTCYNDVALDYYYDLYLGTHSNIAQFCPTLYLYNGSNNMDVATTLSPVSNYSYIRVRIGTTKSYTPSSYVDFTLYSRSDFLGGYNEPYVPTSNPTIPSALASATVVYARISYVPTPGSYTKYAPMIDGSICSTYTWATYPGYYYWELERVYQYEGQKMTAYLYTS